MPVPAGEPFPTTQWSELRGRWAQAAGGNPDALGPLLTRYRPPLLAYLTAGRGLSADDAEDVLQGFFLEKWLIDGLPGAADRSVGRFRTWLLSCLRNYQTDRWRRAATDKRAPERAGPLGETDPPAGAADPAEVFEWAWARGVLDEALTRMRAACAAGGRSHLPGVLECQFLAADPLPYAELIHRFHFASPGAAAHAVRSAKAEFGKALEAVLADEARDEAEVKDLLRDLLAVVGRAGPGLDG